MIKHGLNLFENTEILQISIDFKPLQVTAKVTSDQRGTKRKSVTMDKNGNLYSIRQKMDSVYSLVANSELT